MSFVTELTRSSNEVIPPANHINHQTSSLNQKVSNVAGTKLPCAALLTDCLTENLSGKVSKKNIENAANYMQNTEIPKGQEHYTVIKELSEWSKKENVTRTEAHQLHAAIIHCLNSPKFKEMEPHQLSAPNHSDK